MGLDEFSPEQIEHFRQSLISMQQELTELLADSESAAQPVKLDQQQFGRVSRMDAIQQQSMQKATREQAKQRLLQVGQALTRIAEEEYGWCLQCDELIALQRLEIRPESPLCLACQDKAEHGDLLD